MSRLPCFVIDTSVLVSAFRSRRGYSFGLIDRIGSGQFDTVVTPALFLEYETVLKRPEHALAHRLTPFQVDVALADLLSFLRRIPIVRRTRGETPDGADDLVLEAAVNGFADSIVTYNRKHLEVAARNYGIRVVTPADLFQKGWIG